MRVTFILDNTFILSNKQKNTRFKINAEMNKNLIKIIK